MKAKPADFSLLRDPWTVTKYGRVLDARTPEDVLFDPTAITTNLQNTIIGYYADPPRLNSKTRWLILLKSRQSGASTTAEIGVYPKVAYTPGWDHVCLADTNDRANYLHGRVHFMHQRWPEAIRTPTASTREVRQLTFEPTLGGKMRTLSMEKGAVGIGQTPQSLHWSECPFADAAGVQWSTMWPGLKNNRDALVLLESTPAPPEHTSAEWWRELCGEARRGEGRWVYAFFPFWDCKMNAEPWPEGAALENDEIRLLDKWGPHGLRKEHLAFRRSTMEIDREIRKDPGLFDVWFPFDDLTCWGAKAGGVIPAHVLERHAHGITIPWRPGDSYREYEAPKPGSTYVIGVDPTGYGTRDHAAFQVLEVWDGEWVQVATFAAVCNPNDFEKILFETGIRYNRAMIVVLITGNGTAVASLLISHQYPNLYYEAKNKPGKTETVQSVEKMLGHLTDALLDDLVLRDDDLIEQLGTYKNDKLIEESPKAETMRTLSRRTLRTRRPRHHWDKVSALIGAVFGARLLPQRVNPARVKEAPAVVVPLFDDLSWEEKEKYKAQFRAPERTRKVLPYRRVKRR